MSHILQNGTSIFTSGSNVFRVRDTFAYLYNIYSKFTGGYGLMFDPNPANSRFLLCSGNTVIVIDSNDFSVIAIIAGLYNAERLTWDPVISNNRFFVNTINGIYAIDATFFTLSAPITGFTGIGGLAVDLNNTNHLFVANPGNGTITVLDLTTLLPVTTIPGFTTPQDIMYDQVTSRNRFFITNSGTNEVWVMDGTSYAVLQKISGGGIANPDALSYDPNPANNRFIVGSFNGNAQIIDLGILAITSNITANNVTGIAFDPNPAVNRMLVFDLGHNYLASVTQTIS
jgi:hypothetical protein